MRFRNFLNILSRPIPCKAESFVEYLFGKKYSQEIAQIKSSPIASQAPLKIRIILGKSWLIRTPAVHTSGTSKMEQLHGRDLPRCHNRLKLSVKTKILVPFCLQTQSNSHFPKLSAHLPWECAVQPERAGVNSKRIRTRALSRRDFSNSASQLEGC